MGTGPVSILPRMETLPVSGRAAKTPAARVIELTQRVNLLEIELAEAQALLKADTVADYQRWRSFQDTSFGGVGMAQYWADVILWESVLNVNPQLRGIIEIGTWLGGFSGFLWAQARLRGINFITYDAVKPTRAVRGFKRLDVFAEPGVVQKDILAMGEPLALLCDGGNKPRELKMFGAMLMDERSLVFVHDWGTETLPEDVPDFLQEVYGDFCDRLNGITRIFRPKARGVGRE